MPITEKYTTLGQSTLASGYTAASGSMSVVSAASFPTTGYFSIRTNGAAIYTVTAVSGTTLTVVLESGSDVNLSAGVSVVEVQTARSENALRSEGPGPYDRLGFQAYAGLAWINQGTATGNDDGGRLTIRDEPTATFDFRILKKSLTAPVTFSCWFIPHLFRIDYQRVGICMRESATGKFTILALYGSAFQDIQVGNWSDPNTQTSAVYDQNTQYNQIYFPFGVWFQIQYDGTDLFYRISPDGKNWYQVYTQAKTVPFTTAPNELGVCCLSGNGNVYPCGLTVLSWTEA